MTGVTAYTGAGAILCGTVVSDAAPSKSFNSSYRCAVFRPSKMYGFDFHIFIWPDDFNRKSSIPNTYHDCRWGKLHEELS
jgi:hypothetical protein